MKKLLLSTALLLVFTAPSHAETKAEHSSSHHKEEVKKPTSPAKKEHADHKQSKWGYTGKIAAPHWGKLDKSYTTCKMGKMQSPINIARYLEEEIPALESHYKESPLQIINNGHSIEVVFESGNTLKVGNMSYELAQAHFHTPSEHYLDGAPYPMEIHLVHKTKEGKLGVVGVFLKVGAHNETIEKIWQNVPAKGKISKPDGLTITASKLLPENKYYYKYEGSLTTPPCTEGVNWHILKAPIEISEAQLRAFQGVFTVNARPIQSLNNRTISAK